LFLSFIGTIVFSLLFVTFSVQSQNKNDELKEEEITVQQNQIVDETPHTLVADFYDIENFPNAKLLLNNKTGQPIEVRPTLYNLDGNPMEVAPVTVDTRSHRLINLTDWANLGGENFRQGSLRLFHTGKDLSLGTQIYLTDSENSLSFEERLLELGKFDSHRLESIWWMPRRQAKVRVILSNTSDGMLTTDAKLRSKPQHIGAEHRFTLMPHATRVHDLQNDFTDGNQFANSDIVGLSLEHTDVKSARANQRRANGLFKYNFIQQPELRQIQ
jgi:hypothetical protein